MGAMGGATVSATGGADGWASAAGATSSAGGTMPIFSASASTSVAAALAAPSSSGLSGGGAALEPAARLARSSAVETLMVSSAGSLALESKVKSPSRQP